LRNSGIAPVYSPIPSRGKSGTTKRHVLLAPRNVAVPRQGECFKKAATLEPNRPVWRIKIKGLFIPGSSGAV
jgi:hypothetical protein